jgi:hypothetical protein
MCTGVVYQDVSMNTEVGLQCVLAQTDTYPVDVRVIPAAQFEVVYTTVGDQFVNYDVRPLMVRYHDRHRRELFQAMDDAVVVQVRAQPAVWARIREPVQGSYEVAKVRGHGVLTVSRTGAAIAVAALPPVRPERLAVIAAMPPEPPRANVAALRASIVARDEERHHMTIAAHGPEPPHGSFAAHAAEPPHPGEAGHVAEQPHAVEAGHAAQETHAGRTTPATEQPHAGNTGHGTERPSSHPSGGAVKPSHPSGGAVRPSHPAGGAVKPSHPAGSAEKPSHPAGSAEKPSHPSGGAEKPRAKPDKE